ncbi:MAG: hypothetical protein MZU97_26960 [Bacillus subtilis]|nr:hypothetical protein [Bacillus subtilis]
MALDSAYTSGAKEIDVMLPDASLAMSLDLRKPVGIGPFPAIPQHNGHETHFPSCVFQARHHRHAEHSQPRHGLIT